ncbi:hypothetical protein DUI87_09721 [Hirundo rustica rustica]|uniref:Pro-adrenomedullin n=1 Tax=Hirundo rustica rustica TaxID=333673 RepID=A0A3M0KMK9_HIRRU|nr:hypothetical protein DUI87_09721 [Hirundo rustica rustica]
MKLVHVALLYLGSVTFFEVDAAKVDVATEFKRKWTKWALSRAKRDMKPAGVLRGLGAAADVLPLIRTQDMKEDSRVSPPSNREDAHIRVKRYRQSINRFPHFQTKACRFGTCTVHWLVDELHRAAVNDRNDAAPPNKISPQGYGRRRRKHRFCFEKVRVKKKHDDVDEDNWLTARVLNKFNMPLGRLWGLKSETICYKQLLSNINENPHCSKKGICGPLANGKQTDSEMTSATESDNYWNLGRYAEKGEVNTCLVLVHFIFGKPGIFSAFKILFEEQEEKRHLWPSGTNLKH